jgi:hypothetical protein
MYIFVSGQGTQTTILQLELEGKAMVYIKEYIGSEQPLQSSLEKGPAGRFRGIVCYFASLSLSACWGGWQCCQVAEIPAKKFKRVRGKKELDGRIRGRILADLYQKWQKRD